MSNENADRTQLRLKEFMSMLPLTIEIAGLPKAEPGRHFNEEQMDVRATTIRRAFKVAKQMLLDITRE
jgi:hypothetical protein